METLPRVRRQDADAFLRAAFSRVGLTKAQVDAVVNQLIVISLRGVDTHGIALAERYIEGIKTGQINKRPRPKVVRESPSTAVIDGDRGLGAYLATTATRMAIKKAKRTGVGAVSLINLTHCGALSYYGLLVAEQKMAAIAFTNASRQAAPWGGATPVFGTNPLCFAFPYGNEPIVLDIATTTAAAMKVVFAARDKKPIPFGWALNSQGKPTADPTEAMKGAFLPFGGYKGYGLMLSSEVYSILGGGGVSYKGVGRYFQGGFYVQATNIGAFQDYSKYLRDMRKLVKQIRASKIAEGFERIYLPGEPELETMRKREKEGIPIDSETWAYLEKIAKEFKLPPLHPIQVSQDKRPTVRDRQNQVLTSAS